ncbi:MAG: hypothetical protein IJM79_05780 [Erysipelotrichaceae bacterium]|nr:hypothetical protein [Erysipelotrichaceae bacterium]
MQTIIFINYHDYNEQLAANQLYRLLPNSVYMDANWLCYTEPMRYSDTTVNIIMDNMTNAVNNFLLARNYEYIIVNFPFNNSKLIHQLNSHLHSTDYSVLFFKLNNTSALEGIEQFELLKSEYEVHYEPMSDNRLLRCSQLDTTQMTAFKIAKTIHDIVLEGK